MNLVPVCGSRNEGRDGHLVDRGGGGRETDRREELTVLEGFLTELLACAVFFLCFACHGRGLSLRCSRCRRSADRHRRLNAEQFRRSRKKRKMRFMHKKSPFRSGRGSGIAGTPSSIHGSTHAVNIDLQSGTLTVQLSNHRR